MAIEKVKRTWFLAERSELDALVARLADSKAVHVVDLAEESPKKQAPTARTAAPGGGDVRENVQKLSRALDVLDEFVPPRRAFHENFVNLPAEMTRSEFDQAVADVDVDRLHEQTTALHRRHADATKIAEERRARIARLEPWAAATAPSALTRCGADLGTVPVKAWPRLEAAARDIEGLAVRNVQTVSGAALVAAAWLRAEDGKATDLLDAHGFQSLNLEPGAGAVGKVVRRLRTELGETEKQIAELEVEAAELAKGRRAVLAALAHWEAEVDRGEASGKAVASKRIAVLSGYVRVREMKKLEALLGREFPSVGLIAADPQPDEDVPVSLGGAKLFAPAQFLTSMFGLPNYFEFDPSPFIFLTFLVFFGFCFGDVVYGLMLMATGGWLARKSRDYPSLARFFGLLTWCGVASVIVGVATGSWAADLITGGYLGEHPKSLAERFMLIDPLKRTVVVLGIVLCIGVLNQFYGMALLFFREWRKGNRLAGLCDGGLWLVFLPGLILLLASAMAGLPPVWGRVALWMVLLSGAGLVLTQGRREKTFLGKAITGVVSLYGIMGTYGTTSFIGDTLSYSRLLALGLTTVIVGMSFNIIAGLLTSVPVAGVVFFVIVAVVGHAFNFLISILGGFVHSARLIFVEFFTKFYEGGARPFAPLGAPRTVRVIEEKGEVA